MIFKRKKKKLENFNALGLINDIALPLTPFGEKITNSDVVLICIDRIASQCAKLKGRCIKRSEDGIITERNKNLSFLLKSINTNSLNYLFFSILFKHELIMCTKNDKI